MTTCSETVRVRSSFQLVCSFIQTLKNPCKESVWRIDGLSFSIVSNTLPYIYNIHVCTKWYILNQKAFFFGTPFPQTTPFFASRWMSRRPERLWLRVASCGGASGETADGLHSLGRMETLTDPGFVFSGDFCKAFWGYFVFFLKFDVTY